MVIKIIGIGLCAVIINLILKQYRPEFCVLNNICAGLIIFMLVVDGLKDVVLNYIDIQKLLNIDFDVVSPILKIMGIGYITEFASDVAEESGNKSVATKMIFGGKIAICVVAFPIVTKLINAILSLI